MKETLIIEVVKGCPQIVEIYEIEIYERGKRKIMVGPTEAVTRALGEKGWPLSSGTIEVGYWTVVVKEEK